MARMNTTVRLGQEEDAALARLRRVTPALAAMPLSRLLRLVLMSADQALREGEEAGARDRADRQAARRSRKPRTVVDFFELGYEVGYGERVAGGYRKGKADGENARRSGSRREIGPLTLESSEYDVGYVDGYFGGFVEGFAAGDSDRRSERPFRLPKEDPVVFSHYARGYRAGRLAGEERYDRGVVEGRLAFESGDAYPPLAPDDPAAVGKRDGYFGFARAGLLEGEADYDNERYRAPEGAEAFTAYAFGYRTAGRYRDVETPEENEFAEWSSGCDSGRRDRRKGLPSAAPPDDDSPYGVGYRYGYAGEAEVFMRGKRAGADTSHPGDDGPFAAGRRSPEPGRQVLDLVKRAFIVDAVEQMVHDGGRSITRENAKGR